MKNKIPIGLATCLLLAGNSEAVDIHTGFENAEGYAVGKLTPAQPASVNDIGWGGNQWYDLGGSYADPNGFIVAPGDAPEGSQYYQRLGGGANNLAAREFPAVTTADGNFSLRWQVRLDTDQSQPPYFVNYATIELDDTTRTGGGRRIMTLRYDLNGNISLTYSTQDNIAKWDGTGAPELKSGLNQFVKGGLNVDWANSQIEVFQENTAGGFSSLGTFAFREPATVRVDRIYLGVGPGGTAAQGVSWDDLTLTSTLISGTPVTNLVTVPPYPPSDVVTGAVFHWNTHREEASGSDNWPCTWSDDGNVYTAWGDGGGFGGSNTDGRSGVGVARVEGLASVYSGFNVFGGLNPEGSDLFGGYSDPNGYYRGSYGGQTRCNGKSYAILSAGGILYLWCSPLSDTSGYIETRLARSPDKGQTFALETWNIPGQSGPSPQVVQSAALQFGKDYAGVPPHAAGFVYLYFIGLKSTGALGVQKPGEIYLARVPAQDADIRNPALYEWYASTNTNPAWSSIASDRKPVFRDTTNGVGWCASVSYNAGLARYILLTEHTASFQGNLGLFESTRPWGPWRTIAYLDQWQGTPADATSGSKGFYWNMPNKWVSPDGRDFTMVFTGVGGDDSWNTVDGTFTVLDKATDAPRLSIFNPGSGACALKWPDPSAGWVLEENLDLNTPSWTPSTLPVEIIGTNKCTTLTPATGQQFFRLHKL